MRTSLKSVVGTGVLIGGWLAGQELRGRTIEPSEAARAPRSLALRLIGLGIAAILGCSDTARADLRDDQAAARLIGLGASVRRDRDGRILAISLFPGASKVQDADLDCIDGLTSVTSILLIDTNLTDEAFVHLKNLPSLSTLYIGGSHTDAEGATREGGLLLTDGALAHLEGLGSIRRLTLGAKGFTDAGLVHLKGMSGLRSLGLSSPGFTDSGLSRIEGLTGLTELNLSGARVDGRGLARLTGLRSLNSLVLGPGRFEDEGLRPIADLAGLRRLMFYKSTLADDAPAALGVLDRLEDLTLVETPIPALQLASIRKALPKTVINVEDRQEIRSAGPRPK